MEKTIDLIMCSDKTIRIDLNGENRLIIHENQRSITADKIYAILDYHTGDHFTVNLKNDEKKDEQVLVFFKKLMEDVCVKVNELSPP